MPIALTSQGRDIFESVEVRDPERISDGLYSPAAGVDHHRGSPLSDKPAASSQQRTGMCVTTVTWRLLNDQQCLADLTADRSTRLDFSLQVERSRSARPAAVLGPGRRQRRPAEAADGCRAAPARQRMQRWRSSIGDRLRPHPAPPEAAEVARPYWLSDRRPVLLHDAARIPIMAVHSDRLVGSALPPNHAPPLETTTMRTRA